MPDDPRRSAVRAWLAWRDALYAARHGDEPAGRDTLRLLLREWWEAQRLPKIERLNAAQLDRVLDKIVELEYNGRPF